MINDALLFGLIAAFLLVLLMWQRKDDQFDLRWLLVDTATEKVSLFKVGQFVALIVSSWALIHETRNNHLTEWLFLAYIGTFSGLNVANKVVDKLKTPESK